YGPRKGLVFELLLNRRRLHLVNAAARLHIGAGREKSRQFVAGEQRFLKRRDARYTCEVSMGQDRAPNFLAHTALGENRVPLRWMVGQVGMDLPIEVVQQ